MNSWRRTEEHNDEDKESADESDEGEAIQVLLPPQTNMESEKKSLLDYPSFMGGESLRLLEYRCTLPLECRV